MANVSGTAFHSLLAQIGIRFPRYIVRGRIILEPTDTTIFELEIAETIDDVPQVNDTRDGVKTKVKRFALVYAGPERFNLEVIE